MDKHEEKWHESIELTVYTPPLDTAWCVKYLSRQQDSAKKQFLWSDYQMRQTNKVCFSSVKFALHIQVQD